MILVDDEITGKNGLGLIDEFCAGVTTIIHLIIRDRVALNWKKIVTGTRGKIRGKAVGLERVLGAGAENFQQATHRLRFISAPRDNSGLSRGSVKSPR